MSEGIKNIIEAEPTKDKEEQILKMYQKIQEDKAKLFNGEKAKKPEDIVVTVDNLKEEICNFNATDPTAPEKMIEIINEKKKEFEEKKNKLEKEKKELEEEKKEPKKVKAEKIKRFGAGIRTFSQKIKKLEKIAEAYNSGDLRQLKDYTQREFESLLPTIRGKENEEEIIKKVLFLKKVINTIELIKSNKEG